MVLFSSLLNTLVLSGVLQIGECMLTREDLFLAAKTIYGEARGEDDEGKRAVAHVLINRTIKKIGDVDHSVGATCIRWKQFSAWNEDDPNRAQMEQVDVNDKVFRKCLKAFLEAFDEEDFTKSATHYHTLKVTPSWSKGKIPCYKHGNHLFFNNI